MRQQNIIVLNMATGAESWYLADNPIQALVSAAILEDKRAGDLTNAFVRGRYESKVLYGKMSASLGDLAVRI